MSLVTKQTPPAQTASRLMLTEIVNRLFTGHAAQVLACFPAGCIDLVITSPPYWTAVGYDEVENPWSSYEAYLADMQSVWTECARVLRPNGKLCINAPIMPIPKEMIRQHTRHLKNIAFDIEHGILRQTELQRYSLFIWQKQTSKMMFGSYPHPGNIIENNTIEFINVYVKPGKPPKFTAQMKEANTLSRAEWLDLSQQVWFIYPQDVGAITPPPFRKSFRRASCASTRMAPLPTFPARSCLIPLSGPAPPARSRARCAGAMSASTSTLPISISRRHAFAERTHVHRFSSSVGRDIRAGMS
jgi:hypothetical protein